MNPELEALLPFVTKASRYLGSEVNAIKKDSATVDLTFAFAFPDTYEVGMSHLGLQILYHVLNSLPRVACERVFAPWPDMEAEMKAAGLELATLESGIPLRRCDIVGFSLEYELCYATVLRMLSLAGIPLLASERDHSLPLIIAGGPSAANPEPVAEFFDAFVIGEGEEVLPELCQVYTDWKKTGRDKNNLLDRLADIPGIYVPSLFKITPAAEGTIEAVLPLKKGYDHVDKRLVSNFTSAPWCDRPVVPYMQIIHDRAGIEIARGCTRGCRFCMAGMLYRPVREKSVHNLCDTSRSTLAATGYEELGLLSLSSGDYCGIQPLLAALLREQAGQKVAVSLPSLRVESLTGELIQEIKKIRKTGFTIAPEAGTQRLRDVINKGFTDEEILATASRIYAAGWNLIKLYFMVGLPTETRQDVEGIVSLCREISRLDRRKNLHISISTFVPKPHTPFQWEAFEPSHSIVEKQQFIKDSLRSRTVQVKYHDHRLSLLEAVFSRGDRRLARVLEAAHRLGAGYEAWSEHFNSNLWQQAFANAGIDPARYLPERSMDSILPWEHIRYGISRKFFAAEREKAYRQETTADCRRAECVGCGVCGPGVEPESNAANVSAPAQPVPAPDNPDAVFRYRLLYAKKNTARFLSHLEFSSCFFRALRRAQLPVRYSQGFHPLPRVVFHEALSVGIECEQACCDLELSRHLPAGEVLSRLARQLPEGIELASITENILKSAGAPDTLKTYRIFFPQKTIMPLPGPEARGRSIAEFQARDACCIRVEKKGAEIEVNLKQIIAELRLEADGSVLLKADAGGRSMPKIIDIAGAVFSLDERARKLLRIVSLPYDR